MRAVVRLAAHGLRTRWRPWAVLVLVVAFAGGAVLAAVAGARRTASAYPRFLQASNASDVMISPDDTRGDGYYQALARLPGVAAVAPFVGLNTRARGQVVAPADRRFGRLVDMPKVLAGRLPQPDRADEIAVDQRGAATLRLRVGGTLVMDAVRSDVPPGAKADGSAGARRLRQRVVGIIVTRSSVKPVAELDKIPIIVASTALIRDLGPRYTAWGGAAVKLTPGVTLDSFRHRAEALTHQFPGLHGQGQLLVSDQHTQAATVQRAVRPEAVALAVFALVLALTAFLIVGQAVARLLAASSAESPALAALGMTRTQIACARLAEVAVAVTVGTVVAAGMAVGASPLMPIGTARLAEPTPGVSADMTVLGFGAITVVGLMVAGTAWPAWCFASARGSRRPGIAATSRRPLPARWPNGAPVTVMAGTRLALEPSRRRTAVSARGALAGTTRSGAGGHCGVHFGANLLHLVNTPRHYGQAWDAAIDPQFGAITPQQTQHLIGKTRDISGWTFGNHEIVSIDGLIIPAIGLTAGKGPLLSPTLLEGRQPRTSHEIVLGTATLHRLGRQVGQTVTVTVNGATTARADHRPSGLPGLRAGRLHPDQFHYPYRASIAGRGPRSRRSRRGRRDRSADRSRPARRGQSRGRRRRGAARRRATSEPRRRLAALHASPQPTRRAAFTREAGGAIKLVVSASDPPIAHQMFDRPLARRRLARAQRDFAEAGGVDFLLRRAAGDLAERLLLVKRQFGVAVDLGTPGPHAALTLAGDARIGFVLRAARPPAPGVRGLTRAWSPMRSVRRWATSVAISSSRCWRCKASTIYRAR